MSYLAGSADFVLVDARRHEEFEVDRILRAVNVPHDRVDELADCLSADFAAPLVVYGKTVAPGSGAPIRASGPRP